MYLYTFVFSAYYRLEVKQIASRLDADTVKRTYFNSAWDCVSTFKLDSETPIIEHVYLYELEVNPEDMSPSI